METNETREEFNSLLTHNSRFIIPIEHMVSEEELRMLGLDPEELLHSLNVESNDSENDIEDYADDDDDNNDDDDDDDNNDDDDDIDEHDFNDFNDNDDYEDVDDDDNDVYPGLITNRNHFARVFWPQTSGVENISDTVSSRNFPTVITNYFLRDSSTDDDNGDNHDNSLISVDSENSSSNEENSMHSVSSEEYAQPPSSVDSASSMDSYESRNFVTHSDGSNDESSYSTINLTSSNSSQISLNYSEHSYSYSSTSDSSSH